MVQFMETSAAGGGIGLILSMVVLVVFMYLIIYLPQKRQDKKDTAMRNSIEIGDEVTTIGGVIGRVTAIKEDTFVLETGSDRVKIRFRRSAIASVEKLDMGTGKDSKDAKEMVIGTITYDGIYVGTINKPYAEVKATVYNVDAINVAVSADQKPYYTGSDIKGLKDDYTVTVYALEDPATDEAADALYSMELESDDFVILSGAIELSSFEATAKQYTLAFDAFPVAGSLAAEKEITGGKADATLNVLTDYVAEFSVAEVALDSKVTTAKYAVVGGKLIDQKTVALFRVLIDIDDSICQASCTVSDRKRSIVQGVHLIQSAWLIAGWHQEEVRCTLCLMSRLVAECDPHRKIRIP